jgi:tetratricopeptide (TPR) repeat protein
MRPVLRILIVVAGVGLAGACAKNPKVQLQRYLASGDSYVKQHKLPEATIEYGNAVQIDPLSGVARTKLAEVYLAQGNTRLAFPQYIRAADLLPDDLDLQFKAGYLLFKGGLYTEARVRARAVLEKEPKNVRALLLLGNCLAGLKDSEDAVDVLSRAVSLDPESAGVYTNLGVIQLSIHDKTDAEAAFQRAVEVSKGSAEAYIGLGNFYRAVGDRPAAERAFKQALAASPQGVAANEAMAALYLEWNRQADAEASLKTIAAIAKNEASQQALADFYVSAGRMAEAIGVLEGLAKNPTRFATAETEIALIQFMAGRLDQAQKTIDAALARDPRSVPAIATRARLQLADGKTDQAFDTVKSALAIDSSFAPGLVTLGRVLRAQGKAEDAQKAFNDALTADPHSLPAQLELVDLHRRQGEAQAALELADEAVRTHPASVPARLAQVRTLLSREDDRPRGEAELRSLVAKYPKSAAVQTLLGQHALAENDIASSRQAFQRALDVNPFDMEALTGLVAIDIAAHRPEDARVRVEAVLAKAPDAPEPMLLAAKVYAGLGNSPKAEQILGRLLQMRPSEFEPYALLAELYLTQGRLEEAKKQFIEMARLDPGSFVPPTMMGLLCYFTHDLAGARQWWQRALAIDGRAAAAANNLAWLDVETNGDLEVALELARSARSQLPNQPEINDTLGWIYYKKKMSSTAVQYLSESVDVDGRNPLYVFHLGMAYVQAGEDAKARRALQKALSLNPNFEGAAEARQALTRLVY